MMSIGPPRVLMGIGPSVGGPVLMKIGPPRVLMRIGPSRVLMRTSLPRVLMEIGPSGGRTGADEDRPVGRGDGC